MRHAGFAAETSAQLAGERNPDFSQAIVLPMWLPALDSIVMIEFICDGETEQ